MPLFQSESSPNEASAGLPRQDDSLVAGEGVAGILGLPDLGQHARSAPDLGGDEMGVLAAEVDDGDHVVVHGPSCGRKGGLAGPQQGRRPVSAIFSRPGADAQPGSGRSRHDRRKSPPAVRLARPAHRHYQPRVRYQLRQQCTGHAQQSAGHGGRKTSNTGGPGHGSEVAFDVRQQPPTFDLPHHHHRRASPRQAGTRSQCSHAPVPSAAPSAGLNWRCRALATTLWRPRQPCAPGGRSCASSTPRSPPSSWRRSCPEVPAPWRKRQSNRRSSAAGASGASRPSSSA